MFKSLSLIAMYFAGLLSVLPSDFELWTKIATQAPLAACLVWFMLRLEKILKDHTKSINNLVRSQMVSVMTFHGASAAVRSQAKAVAEDIDAPKD